MRVTTTPPNIVEATRAYEKWLGRQMPLVRADLRRKHEKMRKSPFVFLRATFYRWMQWWPRLCGDAAMAPRVLSIGDLHLENFGTWRDTEARLNWGVNDFDEAAVLPYTNDLVRLAVSAVLASRMEKLTISLDAVVEALLDGYEDGVRSGGGPIVLAERHARLRHVALDGPVDAAEFWDQLKAGERGSRGAPLALLRARLPRGTTDLRCVHRVAGAGSLGRPRFVLIGTWGNALVAREAKRNAPSAVSWALGGSTAQQGARLLRAAIRVPDPFFDIESQWIVRRLAPDCRKIEIQDFPRVKDASRLLRLMGFETANVHAGLGRGVILPHLRKLKRGWLEEATKAMLPAVIDDWKHWKRHGFD